MSARKKKKKAAPPVESTTEPPAIGTEQNPLETMIKSYPPGANPEEQTERQLSQYGIDPNAPHEFIKNPNPRAIGDFCICGMDRRNEIHISAGAAMEERMEQPLRTAAELASEVGLSEEEIRANPQLAKMKRIAAAVGNTDQELPWAKLINKLESGDQPRIPIVDQAIELASLMPDNHPYRMAILEAAAVELIKAAFPEMGIQIQQVKVPRPKGPGI